MLVLSRKCDEEIQIGDHVIIRVIETHSGKVTIGIEAPRDIRVLRREKRETQDLPLAATA